jgi:WD40 repeat protein
VIVSSVQSPPAPRPPSVSVTLPAEITSLTAVGGSPRVAAGLADGRVAIWSPSEAAPSLLLQPHTTRVIAVVTTADGSELVSVAADGTLARTPVAPGAKSVVSKVDLGPTPARAGAFSADGSWLVIGGERGELRVLDTATGGGTTRSGHRTELQAIAMQPGTSIVASASAESDLRLWDARTGREVKRIDCGLSLFALAFSPRDGTLASGGVARRLTLYDPRTFETTGELVFEAPNMISALAWSRDGRRLAVAHIDSDTLGKGGIRIIDPATRRVLATLDTGGPPSSGLVFGGTGDGAVGAALGPAQAGGGGGRRALPAGGG